MFAQQQAAEERKAEELRLAAEQHSAEMAKCAAPLCPIRIAPRTNQHSHLTHISLTPRSPYRVPRLSVGALLITAPLKTRRPTARRPTAYRQVRRD